MEYICFEEKDGKYFDLSGEEVDIPELKEFDGMPHVLFNIKDGYDYQSGYRYKIAEYISLLVARMGGVVDDEKFNHLLQEWEET